MNQALVKVCGVTEVSNALECVAAGADWIGLNFHPASPRAISVRRGAEIAGAIDGKAVPVSLFVDRPFDELADAIFELKTFKVQLHGHEDHAYLRLCSKHKPPLQVIRAFRISDAASITRMSAYLDESEALRCPPHAVLVDAHVPGQFGGTGHAIAESVLDQIPRHPRLILAGGLTPENVAGRVDRVRPWMVDVSSGVESSPGIKDPRKVEAFVAAARGMSRGRD